ncbi:MAG TPA: glucosaminidase domain-containing protein, partial [Sedimentibacter sp.]|nr:glucosaminidase domain-containing protein [Sedimentibacter sp.]
DLVSGLAVNTRKTTGMSAALQVAQAILETGWGQSVPVDKYDGKFSYNLFGIKGEGTKGSVTSNTWEEYNGVAFRIDAEFRAYNNEKESWQDHKDLLLLRERYAPFREVMYDSTKGAWALKRCGYATDSQYAIKLIDIIERYDLKELDEVTI